MSIDEGKVPMTFQVYKRVCEEMMEMDSGESNFTHCVLMLEWNLMSHADSCTVLHVNHIEW